MCKLKKMNKLLLLIFSILLSITLQSQNKGQNTGTRPNVDMSSMPQEGVITGIILEKNNNTPIEYANIIVYSKRDSSVVTGGITDAKGKFYIDKVRYGKFYIDVVYIGYAKYTIPEVVVRPNALNVDLGKIYMNITSEILKEVTIEANVNQVDYKLDKKVINVNQDLLSVGASAVEVLANAPSVTTDIDGNVSLRGTESFLVLIDGRPSPLTGSEALQQIPANTIESIEIITNPSVKYAPDGVGGIINVVLIKDKRAGYNGQVTVNYGSFNTLGGSFNFNYRTQKINLFVGGEYNRRINKGRGETLRETKLNDSIKFLLNNYNTDSRQNQSGNIRFGIDYYINNKNILTISARAGLNGNGGLTNSWAESYYSKNQIDFGKYFYTVNNESSRNMYYYAGELNYVKKFDKAGHEIQFFATYSNNSSKKINQYDETQTDILRNPLSIPNYYRTYETGNNSTYNAKIDYVLPITDKRKIEAGYDMQFMQRGNIYKYQTKLLTNSWLDDSTKYNPYNFNTNIHSGYFIYSDYIGSRFGYQLGLRTEYTDRIFEDIKNNQKYVYNKFDVFPSVHLSYSFSEDLQVMSSYSRRLERPRGYYLNPMLEIEDPNNARKGNPYLLPEYTNSFDFSAQKKIAKNHFVSLELYARQTNNKIDRINIIDSENNRLIKTFDNIGKDLSIGSEIMTNFNFTKWYNFNFSGNVYYYQIKSAQYNNNETYTWSLRLNNTIKIGKIGTSLQIGGFYFGPSISAQGKMQGSFSINAGVKQDFFDRKLSVSLNVRDVFATMKHEFIIETDKLYQYVYMERIAPTFNISVSYKINDFKNRKDKNSFTDTEGQGDSM